MTPDTPEITDLESAGVSTAMDRVDILLVDDRVDKLMALESILADKNVNIVKAQSGMEALRLLLKQDFAVIFLDVQMPVMNGFEIASMIRQRPRSEHTPIIFMTALEAGEAHVSRGYSLGAVDYIFAPVAPEVIRAKAGVFIDLFRKTEQVKRQSEWLRAEAERRAALLETRLKRLLNRLNVGIFRTTLDGVLVEANPAFLNLLGLNSIEAAASADLQELRIPPQERPLTLGRHVEDDHLRERDVRLRRANGTRIWCALSRTVSVGEDGTTYVDGLLEDITDRKQAEEALRESERRFRLMADMAPVMMWVAGIGGERTFVNRPWLEFTGADLKSTLGHGWLDYVHPDDRERCREAFHSPIGRDESRRLEYRLRRYDGVYGWIMASVVPRFTESGSFAGYIGSSVDITDHRLAQDVLEHQARELARSNADLQQFAFVASHDLQEPLRMVASFTDLLARRYRGRLDAKADEYIAFAVDGAKRMQRLIHDLLAYSRIGTDRQRHEPCDTGALFDRAVRDLDLAIRECGAEVTRGPLPTVPGDPTQLAQVFQNLIGNAVKFRSADPPRVRVEAEMKDDAWLFSVRDNGVGIERRFAERVFEIFQRLHRHDQYTGTGIGLAICKRIVEQHGGRIWVESTPGEGSVFRFTIAAC